MDSLCIKNILPFHLDRLTDPDLDLCRVKEILPLDKETVLLILSGSVEQSLYFLRLKEGIFQEIGDFNVVEKIWPYGFSGALVQSGDFLWRVDLSGKKEKLLDLPTGLISLDLSWESGILRIGALVGNFCTSKPNIPQVFPQTRENVTLRFYTSSEGWLDLAEIPEGCNGLSLSSNGMRMVWREPINAVIEEANRAEFYGIDLENKKVQSLTKGAGQVGKALMKRDGSGLIYQANHELKRPITTHMDIWWKGWTDKEPRNLTGGGRCIENFGWVIGEESIWITTVQGLNLKTELLKIDGSTKLGSFGHLAATSSVAWFPNGVPAFETEGLVDLPSIWTGDRQVVLPHQEAFEDLHVVPIQWTSPDGLDIEGVVYEAEGTSSEAPLLVRVHGGPAGTVEALRSQAIRHRHLLRAGYRVFNPAFRGSLGFGDAFAQGNIGCQGEADLVDILSGIEYLANSGWFNVSRVGIFGGSYGGYLTLRALAITDRFLTGVALYGFVDIRRVTMETGDFTYETEYMAPITWPIKKEVRKSDVFSHLGKIQVPLLMLHGDKDQICPVSESIVTYRALVDLGIQVSLVVYPEEGHGFKKKVNQQDSARRTLAWFLEHIPP